MLNKAILRRSVSVVSLALFGAVVVGPVACSSSSEPVNPTGAGGSGGSSGSGGSGGSSGSTGGASGSGTGGNTGGSGGSTGGSGGATGGSAGSTGGSAGSTGGSAGSTGGSAGSAGAGAGGTTAVDAGTDNPNGPFTCHGVAPTGPVVLTSVGATADKFLGDAGPGGTFVYPGTTLPTVTPGSVMSSMSVATYSGFGIYFDSCMDLSAYTGVSFTVASTGLPTGAKITLAVQENSNLPVSVKDKKGACVPAGADVYASCHEPTALIASSGEVSVPWAMFTGGLPSVAVKPAEIVGLKWQFPWDMGAGDAGPTPTYTGSITITNLKFTK
jgi:hypothetical protein